MRGREKLDMRGKREKLVIREKKWDVLKIRERKRYKTESEKLEIRVRVRATN